MRKKFSYTGIMGLVILALIALPSSSNALSIEMQTVYSDDGVTPSGTIEAEFINGASGTVELTLTSNLTHPGEYISNWYFNLNPTLDPLLISITGPAFSGAGLGWDTNAAPNEFSAGPSRYYDILFAFETAEGDDRFYGEETYTFTIAYSGGSITEADFNFGSQPGGPGGSLVSAAHIQGIGENNQFSAWIGPGVPTPEVVPEPATILLLGFGLVGLAGLRRKS